jgi:DNA recombination-dependent growth factor C
MSAAQRRCGRYSMGLIYGSGSFTRFKVDGAIPENYLEDFPKKISRFAFRNIDQASDQERSVGWVNIMDIFDNRLEAMEYLKEPCIALSWRVDVRKVPSRALKQYCREAEGKIKESEKLEFLSKKRRQEIKEEVKSDLMKRAISRAQAYDMIWNMHRSVVLFGSVSNNLSDEFAEFFLQCFGLHLKAIFPYFIASQIVGKEGTDPALLENLSPSLTEVK